MTDEDFNNLALMDVNLPSNDDGNVFVNNEDEDDQSDNG